MVWEGSQRVENICRGFMIIISRKWVERLCINGEIKNIDRNWYGGNKVFGIFNLKVNKLVKDFNAVDVLAAQ